jgi:hypothetical protein
LLAKLKAAGVPIEDIQAFDCSGLGMYFIDNLKGLSADRNSRGMYADCEKITKDQLLPGDEVFHHNGLRVHHVGYVVKPKNGELQVIECKGRDDGVIIRPISAHNWNRFGRPKWFKSEIENQESEEEEMVVYCFQKAALAAGYAMLKSGAKWLDIVTGENNGCDNSKGSWTKDVIHQVQSKHGLKKSDDIDEKLMNAVMSEVGGTADLAAYQVRADTYRSKVIAAANKTI